MLFKNKWKVHSIAYYIMFILVYNIGIAFAKAFQQQKKTYIQWEVN